jgi:hypothetical protein
MLKVTEVVAKEAYQDAAHPVLHEAGKTLVLPIRLLNVVLGPLRVLAAAGDKYWNDLEERVTAKVPQEKLVEPPAFVAGPLMMYFRRVGTFSPGAL